MPDAPTPLEEALERLVTNAESGNRQKRRIVAKLARMTPAQLRRVPPETFARLGPDGLKAFAVASRNSDLAGIAAAPPPSASKPEPVVLRLRRKWHFAHPLLKCLVVMAVCGPIGVAGARLSDLAVDQYTAHFGETISGWPKCSRLDRGEWDCVYRTSSQTLTLNRISAMTGLSPETVIAWNRHLDFRFALPKGAYIAIPRRTARP